MNKKCEGELSPPFTVQGIKRRERGLHAGLNSMYIWSTCKKGANTCHAHQPRPMVYGLRPASRSKVGVYQGFRYPLVLVSFERSCGLHVLSYIFTRMYVCDVINRNRAHDRKFLYALAWIVLPKVKDLESRSMHCLWKRSEVCCDF